jgi:hypothetical protein
MNVDMKKELKIVDLNGQIKEYCQKWTDHLPWLSNPWMPNQIYI